MQRQISKGLVRFGCALACFAAGTAAGLAASAPGPSLSKFTAITPCPALVAAAKSAQIPLTGMDPKGDAGVLDPGDCFTALVTFCEPGGSRSQWLLYLDALPASPKPRSSGPAGPMVLYSGRGARLEYASAPSLVRLRTIGPFIAAGKKEPKVEDTTVQFTLDKGFLSLGLQTAAAAIYRAETSHAKGNLWFGPAPPKASEAAEARQLSDSLQLTDGEERAVGGMVPALLSYVKVVNHTRGLEDILYKVVDKPSVWSVVRHVGVSANLSIDSKHFAPADPSSWRLPADTPAWFFPMQLELNRRLALVVTLTVTSPSPPLLSCGGIVGMLAERPGDPETYLTLRIISARRAAINDTAPYRAGS
jgi:hypothetical protein